MEITAVGLCLWKEISKEPSPILPEIVKLILQKLDTQTLHSLNLTSKIWHKKIGSDHSLWNLVIETELIEKNLRNRVFGPKEGGNFPRSLIEHFDQICPFLKKKKAEVRHVIYHPKGDIAPLGIQYDPRNKSETMKEISKNSTPHWFSIIDKLVLRGEDMKPTMLAKNNHRLPSPTEAILHLHTSYSQDKIVRLPTEANFTQCSDNLVVGGQNKKGAIRVSIRMAKKHTGTFAAETIS